MTPTPEARRVAVELASRIIDIMSGTGVGKTWAMVVKNKRMLATDVAYQALTRAAEEAREARDIEWTEYVDWLNDVMAGHYQLSMIHGFQDSDELIAEGKQRRAKLGYVPKGELAAALRQAGTASAPDTPNPGPDPLGRVHAEAAAMIAYALGIALGTLLVIWGVCVVLYGAGWLVMKMIGG